jgi:murein DD-endopeptidase MepM/ murein hydrolase activator NlpD
VRTVTRFLIASALLILLIPIAGSAASPSPNRGEKPARAKVAGPRDEAVQPAPRHTLKSPVVLGPAPRLSPITRFLPPIDPWVQSGLGWGDPVMDEDGEPLCSTNNRPLTSCDPAGPRPFLHAGFDALPAPDRTVRASAAGRVVFALPSFAPFAGGRGEAGGVVLIEHDLDGDPATPDDHLVTIYEHVEPLVNIGAIVQQGT